MSNKRPNMEAMDTALVVGAGIMGHGAAQLGAYGPFEIMDQAGADTYLGVYEYLYAKLQKQHFKPPGLLAKQVRTKRLGLKTSQGFYDYGPGTANAMRRDRDRKFYARLKLVKAEQEQSRRPEMG